MKVSVVIPVYNVEPYLKRCVESVRNQTYKDLEILLVDDGSKDNSGALCDELAAQDSRIRVIHQKNQGLSGARNTGINTATGDYIIFIDSDDEWLLNDGIETLVHNCDDITDIICFKAVDIWKDERKSYSADYDIEAISRLSDAQALFRYIVKTQTLRLSACLFMIRRIILIDNEIYFPSRRIGEDFFWHMHLWQYLHHVKMVNLNLYGYWHRQGSITTSNISIKPYQDYDKTFSYWEEQCQRGCVNGDAILGYMANIWINRGYRVYALKKDDRPLAIDILHKHVGLLDYAVTPKAKRVALLVRILGVRNTTTVLGLYWRLRSRIKGHAV